MAAAKAKGQDSRNDGKNENENENENEKKKNTQKVGDKSDVKTAAVVLSDQEKEGEKTAKRGKSQKPAKATDDGVVGDDEHDAEGGGMYSASCCGKTGWAPVRTRKHLSWEQAGPSILFGFIVWKSNEFTADGAFRCQTRQLPRIVPDDRRGAETL